MPGFLFCCLAHQAHRGAPLAGVLLCTLVRQALKGAPWVGPYSVVQCISPLTGLPLCCSPTDASRWGEAVVMGPPPALTQQYLLASMAAWLSSTGISHHDLLPHTPLICLTAVNSSLRPGIAPQSLNSSSQPLRIPGDLCPSPELCIAVARTA